MPMDMSMIDIDALVAFLSKSKMVLCPGCEVEGLVLVMVKRCMCCVCAVVVRGLILIEAFLFNQIIKTPAIFILDMM